MTSAVRQGNFSLAFHFISKHMYNGYTDYFQLNDIPFSIAPNPHYLFMSHRHKEALAHLTHGLGESGGFVLLTGEVGTGKTTVSKCLLERLPQNTQAAFILNPTLSAIELLATVCDELHITIDKTAATLKLLTDAILKKLIENHEQGKNTLLIIDEAQHLQPQVLEQLRLLTNLETHTKKLLQVILIGQPELQQLLKRRDLRQLAQRITARYHLMPLNLKEVERYIKHRLAVAGGNEVLFKDSAIKLIHKISGGVPRLVNHLCDRSLLGAYSLEKRMVTKAIVTEAAKETLNIDAQSLSVLHRPWFTNLAIASGLLVVAIGSFVYGQLKVEQAEKLNNQIINQQLVNEQKKQERLISSVENKIINSNRDIYDQFVSLFSSWQIHLGGHQQQPCDKALSYQLQCYWFNGEYQRLKALNKDAIVVFEDINKQPYYGIFKGEKDDLAVVNFNGVERQLKIDFFKSIYTGQAVLLWRSPTDFVDAITDKSSPQLIQWLENQLSVSQQRSSRNISSFDPLLANQLGQYQANNALIQSEIGDIETVISLTLTDVYENSIKQVKLGGGE